MPEGFFVTESCMIRDLGNTDFGPLLPQLVHLNLVPQPSPSTGSHGYHEDEEYHEVYHDDEEYHEDDEHHQ